MTSTRSFKTACGLLLFAPRLFAQNTYFNSSSYEAGEEGAYPVQSYVSRPNLTAPAVNVRINEASWDENELVMLPYRYSEGRDGLFILDSDGALVWASEDFPSADLKVQTYQDEPVLTYYVGPFLTGGYGRGAFDVLNVSYDVIHTVEFQTSEEGRLSDFHDLIITANNTFLIPAYVPHQTDLTSRGGAADGWIFDCQFQELDADNNVLFNWSGIESGVSIAETWFDPDEGEGTEETPYDYCHINSLEKDDEGNYIVSVRGPSAIYKVDGSTGDIIWRLGGMEDDFGIPEEDTFWYQHDARWLNSSGTNPRYMSLFDNNGDGSGPAIEPPSARGMIWAIDEDALSAELVYSVRAPSGRHSSSQGGMHQLPDEEGYFIGWGSEPFYSQFDNAGNLVYDVAFAPENTTGPQAYRVYKQFWTGFPLTSPDLGFEGERVYVSWNGATNVSEWSLAYGDGPEDLQSSISFARTGFESNTTYDEEGFYMAVVGLNADGDCLGVSELHYTSNATSSGLSVSCADIEGVQEASAETSGAGEEADEDSDSSSSTPPTIFRTTLSLEVGGALGLALCLL